MNKELGTGTYKHSKTGKLYTVLGVAKHSETLEDLAVYVCQYYNEKSHIWVRPVSMFLEEVELEGEMVPRFKYIEYEYN